MKKQISELFTNERWKAISSDCLYQSINFNNDNYCESIGMSYFIRPVLDHVASKNKNVFDPKKAAAMYFWYKIADRKNKFILDYFPEYKRCIDKYHTTFNSNYGYYAKDGLTLCINELLSKKSSRQACFMINNNKAMSPFSIDKLCTNAVMFFIRGGALKMIVQMRSSNLLTLLPYDAFIFSVWYAKAYNKLMHAYPGLKTASITIQVASLHYYMDDFYNKMLSPEDNGIEQLFTYEEMCNNNFENILEQKLLKYLD